jgi:hypothetical protein
MTRGALNAFAKTAESMVRTNELLRNHDLTGLRDSLRSGGSAPVGPLLAVQEPRAAAVEPALAPQFGGGLPGAPMGSDEPLVMMSLCPVVSNGSGDGGEDGGGGGGGGTGLNLASTKKEKAFGSSNSESGICSRLQIMSSARAKS